MAKFITLDNLSKFKENVDESLKNSLGENVVDLDSDQTIAGNKHFTGEVTSLTKYGDTSSMLSLKGNYAGISAKTLGSNTRHNVVSLSNGDTSLGSVDAQGGTFAGIEHDAESKTTNVTGQFNYHGVEIATLDDIPDSSGSFDPSNYYSKEETYSKEEVNTIVGAASGGGTTSISGTIKVNAKASPSIWKLKNALGFDYYSGNLWSDGLDIYYSKGTVHYVFDKNSGSWVEKTWSGATYFNGEDVWTDGVNIYLSYIYGSYVHYVLDIEASTWTEKTWSGLTNFAGSNIWFDGINIYYSLNSNQYVLNVKTSTWSTKTWSGLTSFMGRYVWSDGTNIYYSYNGAHYVLDKGASTWSEKTWVGLTNFAASDIWSDGNDIYCSNYSIQYVLDTLTSTWTKKSFGNFNSFCGRDIFSDETNTYVIGLSGGVYNTYILCNRRIR